MNKEEMFKNLSDKDKKEVLSLMSFMKKFKEQDRKKELYATYEEYLDLIHISEHLNNENESLQSQLDIANKKLEQIKEKIEDYNCIYNKGFPYTLLLAIRGKHPNENQYLELDKVLEDFNSIIGGDYR